MRIRNITFRGGYRFLGFAGQPRPEVAESPLPERLMVVVGPAGAGPAALQVASGAAVAAGQILARDDEAVGSAVLSPVDGVVEAVKTAQTARGESTVVVIRAERGVRPESPPESRRLSGGIRDWEGLDPADLEDLLYRLGATAAAPQGIPTRFRSSPLRPEEVAHIVVLEAQAEVFNPSPAAILADREPPEPGAGSRPPHQGYAEAAAGLAILKRIMPQAAVHLAFSRSLKDTLCRLGRACLQAELEAPDLVAVNPKYPVHHEAVLLPAVLGRELPRGSSAADQGVVLIDVQGLLQVFDAVARGRPLVDRIVALGGSGFVGPVHVRARLGTPVGEVVSDRLRPGTKHRLVLNGALSGPALLDPSVPVDATFTSVLALPELEEGPLLPFAQPGFRQDSYTRTFAAMLLPFFKGSDTNLHGERRPCISCGYCEQVCPVRILPYLLHRHIHRGLIDESLVRFQIFACIDCGLCSYVCTSKIPLAEQIREAKTRLRDEGLEPQAAAGRNAGGQA